MRCKSAPVPNESLASILISSCLPTRAGRHTRTGGPFSKSASVRRGPQSNDSTVHMHTWWWSIYHQHPSSVVHGPARAKGELPGLQVTATPCLSSAGAGTAMSRRTKQCGSAHGGHPSDAWWGFRFQGQCRGVQAPVVGVHCSGSRQHRHHAQPDSCTGRRAEPISRHLASLPRRGQLLVRMLSPV